MRDLWRAALWGLAASAALAGAGYAGLTATGQDRITVAAAYARELIHPSGKKPSRPMDIEEGRKLADEVRSLASDRGQIQSRVASLEGRIAEITSAIEGVEKAVALTQRPTPENAAAPAEDVTSSIGAASSDAPPRERASASRTEFGVDLGNANNLDGLRTLWANTRQRHATPLDGLRPIVQLRERPRPAPLELRLVAGPVANAAAAARLCATLVASGALCQPAVFDGQRLAVR
jgi:hypothetical protein